MRKTVIFACGGTGGHIKPALAIATALRTLDKEIEIVFCGTENGLEATLVPEAGFEFYPIEAKPFVRRFSKELFDAFVAFFKGKKQALNLVDKLKPSLCVGTGGYVCAPLMAAAKKRGVQRLLHEQNAVAGKSNKLMSTNAIVCISYERTEESFPKAKRIVLTGNPIEEDCFSLDKEKERINLGFSLDEKLVLATGGSLGARRINLAVLDYAKTQAKRLENGELLTFDAKKNLYKDVKTDTLYVLPKVILAAGSRLFEETIELVKACEPLDLSPFLSVQPFLSNLKSYMAASDLIIARAGAMTAAEIAGIGKPVIFIPYPYAAENHQHYNAIAFENVGAGRLVDDDKLEGALINDLFLDLFKEEKILLDMAKNSKMLSYPEASRQIATLILETLSSKGGDV